MTVTLRPRRRGTDGDQAAGVRPAAARARRRWTRLAGAGVIAVVLALASWAYSQRHQYHLDIRPGQADEQVIEVPMQRGAEHKRYARARLPVTCRIQSETGAADLLVNVMETAHTLHKLRARVRVYVPVGARPGRRVYQVSFRINDVGGWPAANLVVNVR